MTSPRKNKIYLAEMGQLMPENKLKIIECLAKKGPLNKSQIAEKSKVSLTNVRHHVPKLLEECIIRKVSAKPYRNRGLEVVYQIRVKGLIIAIIYETSPVYHPFYRKVSIEGAGHEHDHYLLDYEPKKTLIPLPEPYFSHYLGTLDIILKKNQHLLGIDYKAMNGEVLDIAYQSIIIACYSICSDYRGYMEQKKPTVRSVLTGQPIIPYEEEFVSRFLFQLELTKIDGWERWFDTLTEDPKLKRRCLEYMKARKSRLERDEAEISRTLTAIDEIGARYAL